MCKIFQDLAMLNIQDSRDSRPTVLYRKNNKLEGIDRALTEEEGFIQKRRQR